METAWQDVRYACRVLAKSPAFSLVAITALALAIGADTAIFSVVNAVLLRPLPYSDPDRLVVALHNGNDPVSPADFLEWREQNTVFEQVSAAEFWTPNLTGTEQPEQIWAIRATDDLFDMLGTRPMLGRAFALGDGQSDAEPVVVLSHRLWQRRFGGDGGLVGQSISLDGVAFRVIGVMPPAFEFPLFWAAKAELWAPLPLANRINSRGQSLRIFARLKAGTALDRAQAEMDTIAAQIAQAHPETNANLGVTVIPLHHKVVGNVRPILLVLLGAVGFVMLIACANVANLLLARATSREKEVALRLALGATRPRLLRQFLTESLVLGGIGGIGGLLLSFWIVSLAVTGMPEGILPRHGTIGIDRWALGFTVVLSILSSVVFGVVPALQTSRLDLNESLKEGGRQGAGGPRRRGLRNLLVVSEVAMALVLLIGAGLMIRTFVEMRSIDPGFNPTNVLTMTVSVAGTNHSPRARRAAFFEQALEDIKRLPGVESASAVNHLPLYGDIWTLPVTVEGRPEDPPGQRPSAAYRVALPDYFQSMGITLRQGRDFTLRDTEQTAGVVVINETMARRYWPGEEAIGKRIRLGSNRSASPWLSVIGIVKDLKQTEWTRDARSEMVLPYLQSEDYLSNPASRFSYLTLTVRTRTPATELAPAVRKAIWSIEPDAPISSLATMEQVIADQLWQPRFSMSLLAGFALVALLLAAVGIYGVMAYAVSQRTNEMGIRMALGAQRSQVMGMVIRQGMGMVLIGTVIGLSAAFGLTRLIAGLLFGVTATDPLTFSALAALLVAVALVACYIPARRATRVDPMIALRYE